MDDSLKISLPEVSNTAGAIRNYNQSLDDVLSYVSKLMNELHSIWESDGEETLLQRFTHFSSRFIDESETIESYATFLDNTVSTYDSLESTITANASNFE